MVMQAIRSARAGRELAGSGVGTESDMKFGWESDWESDWESGWEPADRAVATETDAEGIESSMAATAQGDEADTRVASDEDYLGT